MTPDFSALAGRLREYQSFLLVSHHGPDGDSIGSMLAMGHLLKALNKEVELRCEDPVPDIYVWLSGANEISSDTGSAHVDATIMLDVSRKQRLGKILAAVPSGVPILTIDHHLDDAPEGDIVVADSTYSATGELVAELFHYMNVPISLEAAQCLYVAIATDTGGFRFANTSARCLITAAALVEVGLDVADISARVFDSISHAKLELLRRALQRLTIDNKVAYTVLTAQDLAETHARSEDHEGLVNYARNIVGIELGILFREIDSTTVKVSLRSHGAFNCARFLAQFGGGGHAAAAGATINMPLETALHEVLAQARQFSLSGMTQ